jgi:hypothetical protein
MGLENNTNDSFMDFEKEMLGNGATFNAAAADIADPALDFEAAIGDEPAAAIVENVVADEATAVVDEAPIANTIDVVTPEVVATAPAPQASQPAQAPAPVAQEVPAPAPAPVVEVEETNAPVLGDELVEEAPAVEEDAAAVEEEEEDAPGVEASSEESSDEDDDDDDDFDVLNIFSEQATSSELGAGVHERVRLISVSGERRKDNNGNLVKKQFFLKFKKFSKDDVDLGEKEVSFFLVDASKDSAVNNLLNFTAQVVELLGIFYSPSELEEKFDPFGRVFYNADNDDRDEDTVKADFHNTRIKKAVIKNEKGFTAVQNAICQDAAALLAPFCGFEGPIFRLKLVESDDNKYIEIPRFSQFVEKAGVDRESSVLYKE